MHKLFRSCPRGLRICGCALGLLLVAASVFWGLSAWRYNRVISGWIDQQQAAGCDVQFDDRRLGGFPLRIAVTFTNMRWKNRDAIAFYAAQMSLHARPWQWNIFDAKFKGRVELDAVMPDSGQALVLSGLEGHAHIELDAGGDWAFASVRLAAANFGHAPDFIFKADKLDASAQRPDRPATNHNETGLTVMGEAQGLTIPSSMPSPFGDRITDFTVALRVMDAMPDFRKRESVAAWNQDSGVVEFDRFAMKWGPMDLAARGTMGFDDDLQPEGAFSATLGGQDEVLKRLTQDGFIPPRQADMLGSALQEFAKSGKKEAAVQQLPITVQLGGLFIGPIRIFGFPEIKWPAPVTLP